MDAELKQLYILERLRDYKMGWKKWDYIDASISLQASLTLSNMEGECVFAHVK